MLSMGGVRRLLEHGIASGVAVSDRVKRICRDVAVSEVGNIANLMETEPMGLQFRLLAGAEPTSAFKILRARHPGSLGGNPFRPDSRPHAHTRVAIVTRCDEAI